MSETKYEPSPVARDITRAFKGAFIGDALGNLIGSSARGSVKSRPDIDTLVAEKHITSYSVRAMVGACHYSSKAAKDQNDYANGEDWEYAVDLYKDELYMQWLLLQENDFDLQKILEYEKENEITSWIIGSDAFYGKKKADDEYIRLLKSSLLIEDAPVEFDYAKAPALINVFSAMSIRFFDLITKYFDIPKEKAEEFYAVWLSWFVVESVRDVTSYFPSIIATVFFTQVWNFLLRQHPDSTTLRQAMEVAVSRTRDIFSGGYLRRGRLNKKARSSLSLGTFLHEDGDGHYVGEFFAKVEDVLRDTRGAGMDDPVKYLSSLGDGESAESAVLIALYSCLRYEGDFKKVMTLAVSHGGDRSATGFLAGAISGLFARKLGYDLDGYFKDSYVLNLISDVATDLVNPPRTIGGRIPKDQMDVEWVTKNIDSGFYALSLAVATQFAHRSGQECIEFYFRHSDIILFHAVNPNMEQTQAQYIVASAEEGLDDDVVTLRAAYPPLALILFALSRHLREIQAHDDDDDDDYEDDYYDEEYDNEEEEDDYGEEDAYEDDEEDGGDIGANHIPFSLMNPQASPSADDQGRDAAIDGVLDNNMAELTERLMRPIDEEDNLAPITIEVGDCVSNDADDLLGPYFENLNDYLDDISSRAGRDDDEEDDDWDDEDDDWDDEEDEEDDWFDEDDEYVIHRDGPTPHGGVRMIMIPLDEYGDVCHPQDAAEMEIKEYDSRGKIVFTQMITIPRYGMND